MHPACLAVCLWTACAPVLPPAAQAPSRIATPRDCPPASPSPSPQLAEDTPPQCAAVWAPLHAGDFRAVPLQQRCRLAAAVIGAAVDTLLLVRSEWQRIDGETITAALLAGADRRPLITYNETCAPIEVRSVLDPTMVTVTMLGQVTQPTRPALVLRLDAERPDTPACGARFSWTLGDNLGNIVQPFVMADGRTIVLKSAIVSSNIARPRLVIDVVLEAEERFVVTRKAIEP